MNGEWQAPSVITLTNVIVWELGNLSLKKKFYSSKVQHHHHRPWDKQTIPTHTHRVLMPSSKLLKIYYQTHSFNNFTWALVSKDEWSICPVWVSQRHKLPPSLPSLCYRPSFPTILTYLPADRKAAEVRAQSRNTGQWWPRSSRPTKCSEEGAHTLLSCASGILPPFGKATKVNLSPLVRKAPFSLCTSYLARESKPGPVSLTENLVSLCPHHSQILLPPGNQQDINVYRRRKQQSDVSLKS